MRSPLLTVALAVLLGVGTCVATLLLRFNHLLTARISAAEGATANQLVMMPRERGWDFWSSQIDSLTKELKNERAALEKRAEQLDALALRLEAEKAELKRARTEVEAIRDEITEQIPVLETAEKANLKSLSRSYSSMRPKEAVTILSAMDDETTVKILAMMKPDVVGAILQQMAVPEPGADDRIERAARLSNQLRLLEQEDLATQ